MFVLLCLNRLERLWRDETWQLFEIYLQILVISSYNDCPKSWGTKKAEPGIFGPTSWSHTKQTPDLQLVEKPDFPRPPRLPYRSQGAWSLRLSWVDVGTYSIHGTHFEGIVTHQEAITWTHQKLEKCKRNRQVQKKSLSIGLRFVEIHLSMFIYQTQHRKQVGTTKRVGHVNHLINHPMVVGPFSDQANWWSLLTSETRHCCVGSWLLSWRLVGGGKI